MDSVYWISDLDLLTDMKTKIFIGLWTTLPMLLWMLYTGSILYELHQIPPSDIKLTRSGSYYENGRGVYYRSSSGGFNFALPLTKVHDADVDTFTCAPTDTSDFSTTFDCNAGYARDAQYAYLRGEKIEGSDGQSFVFLSSNWTKDKNYFYHNGRRQEMVDEQSFVPTGLFSGYDKDNLYKFTHDNNVKITPRIQRSVK